MNAFTSALRRPDTVTIDGLSAAVRALKAMPVNPMSRVSKMRVAADVYEACRGFVARKDEMGQVAPVELVCHPFVPKGFALGFTSKDELVLIIGPEEA